MTKKRGDTSLWAVPPQTTATAITIATAGAQTEAMEKTAAATRATEAEG